MATLAFIIGILVMVIGLGLSIALHEIGHLVPAKRFGVRVGQYMVGFGPTLWSKVRGETEYGVKLLPLGGYISMAGMYPRQGDTATTASGAPAEPHTSEPAADDEAVARTEPGTAASETLAPRRDKFFRTLVQDARTANEATLEGADDSRTFFALPTYKRVIIMLGGPFMNLLIALVLFTVVLSGIGVQTVTTTVGQVSQCVVPAGTTQSECAPGDPASPAAAAGLEPGDVLVAIDGASIDTFEQAQQIIRTSPGVPLRVSIERDGQAQTLTITPALAERPVYDERGAQVTDAAGTPQTQRVGFIGMTPAEALERQPIWAGPAFTAQNVGAVVGIVAQLPVKLVNVAASLFTGTERDPNGPLSVVGVGAIAGEVAALDAPILSRVAVILQLLASLNVALFVFNLIPLLPLDGGHVAIALWDGLRRAWARLRGRAAPQPTDATRLVPLTFVVVIALGAMGALLIVADLLNPVRLFGG